MNLPINIVDVLILLVLIAAVPALVSMYLNGGPKGNLVGIVIALGIVWVVFGMVSEDLIEWVTNYGFERADSYTHEGVAHALIEGRLPHFFDELPTGNNAYQAFVYGVFLSGAQISSVRAINAFCGLWGGLILAGYLKNYVVWEKRGLWILLAVIFFPSTVFWASGNMKEGLTYWGICLMFSAALTTGKRAALVTPGLIAGMIVCGLMRPHMAVAWLIAIGSVTLLSKGRVVYALICLAALPLLFSKMQSLAQNDFSSIDSTLAMLQAHSSSLRSMGGSTQTGPSIPVISGLLAIFFRPFPWESRSIFMAVCALEIWTVTLTMFRSWWRATSEERRFLWRTPAIRVALLAVAITSVLFSYFRMTGYWPDNGCKSFPH